MADMANKSASPIEPEPANGRDIEFGPQDLRRLAVWGQVYGLSSGDRRVLNARGFDTFDIFCEGEQLAVSNLTFRKEPPSLLVPAEQVRLYGRFVTKVPLQRGGKIQIRDDLLGDAVIEYCEGCDSAGVKWWDAILVNGDLSAFYEAHFLVTGEFRIAPFIPPQHRHARRQILDWEYAFLKDRQWWPQYADWLDELGFAKRAAEIRKQGQAAERAPSGRAL